MNNSAIKNGLILGGVWVVWKMALYLIDPSLLASWYVHLIFLAAVYFMYRSAAAARADNGGTMSFGEGLVASFLTIVIGLLIGQVFNYVLMVFIDPTLPEVIKEKAIEQMEMVAESFSMGDDALDEAMEALESQDMTPTVLTTLSNYLVMLLIPYLPTALIISAITKKNDDHFA